MLKVQHITTGYGKKQVLNDVSFEINKSEIVLLTGGNGSGKSTVLKTICGLLKPWTDDGRVFFEENNITALSISKMIRIGIVYVPQKKNVFEDFTIEENLLTFGCIYSKAEAKKRRDNVYNTIPLLAEMRKYTPFHLSEGQKQLLAFGNVLMHSPKLVLFDEPFAGIDENNADMLCGLIKKLQSENVTFLIVEHKKYLFDSFDKRVIKIDLGTIKE